MAGKQQHSVFGVRREPHTVIIARGNDIRHFTIRPWLAALIGCTVAAASIGYLVATSYLVLRDDLIGSAVAHQARMQQAYEDRIAVLRAQVDRITSRQMLDQQLMESKVSELLDRQSKLTEMHGRLGTAVERAEAEAGSTPADVPVPVPAQRPATKPETRADLGAASPPSALAFAAEAARPADPFKTLFDGQGRAMLGEATADRADKMFVAINRSLRSIETDQIAKLRTLTDDANGKTEAIAATLQAAGLTVDVDYGKEGVGGPWIAPSPARDFDSKVAELDEALDTLDAVKEKARQYPIGNPAPGRPISSTFGVRTDPILGIPAMHAGMDFRASIGLPVHVTAPGTVTKAGWNGGYGRMVEVDHGGGLVTRYAHLSEILVQPGQKLDNNDVVGQVGSSGRSTGPHLHYEVRRNGEAIDPLQFLKAGRKLDGLL